MVLLSPGPVSRGYFEDAYLAHYLGYTLVEGGDLTVRGTCVYLKTLGGLLPVDVILRRVYDEDCDPLDLKGSSSLGVPGLVQAVRSGQVVVANALGSGFVEAPALMALWPELCRELLGEELRLPSVPTWWCARAEDWDYVRTHFDDLILRPALAPRARQPIATAELTPLQRQDLLETVARHREEFVAQAPVAPSTAPVWCQGGLQAWHVGLRAFAVAAPDGAYEVLPGGLAHAAVHASALNEFFRPGRRHKDVWVLSDQPVAPVSLLHLQPSAVELRRSGNDLPSRVADNLFWLGRHIERAEGLVRQLRSCVARMTAELEPVNPAELAWLMRALGDDIHLPDLRDDGPALILDGLRAEVMSFLFQPSRSGGCHETLRQLYRTASLVRDRLSVDTWRLVSRLDLDVLFPLPKDQPRLGNVLLLLNEMLSLLSALSGLGMESMTRGPGWRFMDMGRRLERALSTLRLLRTTLVGRATALATLLEAILEIADSSMTYRYRYMTSLQLAPVLDLLLIDETNPRSVGFQLRALADHARQLPAKRLAGGGERRDAIGSGHPRPPAFGGRRGLGGAGPARGPQPAGYSPGRPHDAVVETVGQRHPHLPHPHRSVTAAGHASPSRRGMKCLIQHTTTYRYSEPASLGHSEARLTPRTFARQRCLSCRITVQPQTAAWAEWDDYFGNHVSYFTVEQEHAGLTIAARSEVELAEPQYPAADRTLAWEQVRTELAAPRRFEAIAAAQFLFDSPHVRQEPWVAAIRRPIISARSAAAGSGAGPDRADSPRVPLHPGVDFGEHADSGGVRTAAGRVPGLRPPADRVPAFAGAGGPLRQRLLADGPAAGQAQADRRRRLARLAQRLLSGRRLAGCRPHQQPDAGTPAPDPGLGPRVPQRLPRQGRRPGRRPAPDARRRRRHADRLTREDNAHLSEFSFDSSLVRDTPFRRGTDVLDVLVQRPTFGLVGRGRPPRAAPARHRRPKPPPPADFVRRRW